MIFVGLIRSQKYTLSKTVNPTTENFMSTWSSSWISS